MPAPGIYVINGGQDQEIGIAIAGTYVECGKNHELPVFMNATVSPDGRRLHLYAWRDQLQPQLDGWYSGPDAGGDRYWIWAALSNSPPERGWRTIEARDDTIAVIRVMEHRIPAAGAYDTPSASARPQEELKVSISMGAPHGDKPTAKKAGLEVDCTKLTLRQAQYAGPRERDPPVDPATFTQQQAQPGWCSVSGPDVSEMMFCSSNLDGIWEDQVWEFMAVALAPAGLRMEEYYAGTEVKCNSYFKGGDDTPAFRVKGSE